MTPKIILAIAPTSATGGALIHSSILKLFAEEKDCEVHFWGLDTPFDYDPKCGIRYHFPHQQADNSPIIQSTLKYLSCIEEIVNYSKTHSDDNHRMILFGSFLFPFCNILYQSAIILNQYGIKFKLFVQPTGSDIWRLSSSLREITKAILGYSTTILAYSYPFANEIKQYCSENASIKIIPPFIDTNHFTPVLLSKKRQLRIENQLVGDSLVFCCISNMRFVKGVPNTIQLAFQIALRANRKAYLLLVGPLTRSLSECLGNCHENHKNDDYVEYQTGNLLIRYYGLKQDVRLYFYLSDFSINTSYHDSFNTALGEAMSCGIPVISSSAPGIFSFPHSPIGYLYDDSDQAALALQQQEHIVIPENEISAISRFVIRNINVDYYYILSDNARNFILQSFSKITLQSQYKQLFQ